MDRYLATYNVEFLSPRTPPEWPPAAFERALDHLLVEETLARRTDGTLDPSVTVALSEGLGREDVAPLRFRYGVAHTVRFAPDVPADERVRRLHDWLADMLGVTPRQFEGPWNITAIRVEPAE